MQSTLRYVHAGVAWLFVLAILVQVFLAGTAIVNLGGSGNFATHIDFGYTVIGILALAVLIAAIAARAGRRDIGIAFGMLVLYVVQTSLPYARSSIPEIAALHPVNALLLFGLAVIVARRALRQATAPRTDAAVSAVAAAAEAPR
ncbi:MAG TPA: DUF6220 domain-containing protein [Candidatus Limnocylindrales bacterium]|nr:DUF6220 domain-containing protein [Candidatus Limnocylindrales bacterium]